MICLTKKEHLELHKKINEEKFFDLYDDYMHRLITKTEMAKRLRISKPTLDKLIREKKEQGLI